MMLELNPDERIIYNVHRSRVGIIPHIVSAIATFIGLLVFMFLIAYSPQKIAGNFSRPAVIVVAFCIVIVVEAAIYLLVKTYYQNALALTNLSVIQRLQLTPFSSKMSQLSLTKIEDVNVQQGGLVATMFNFGTLNIETAGSEENFVFPFAKQPHLAAQAIIQAREALARPAAPEQSPLTQPPPSEPPPPDPAAPFVR